MRIVHFLAGLAVLLCLAASPALAADPALVIVYAGNTYGYFDPCPTCGPEKLGGLARRATYLQKARQDPATTGKVLAVAGAWEFAPEISAAPPQPEKLPAVAAAQARLGYDAGAITPDEVRTLTAQKAVPPPGFTVLGSEPATKLVTVAGKSVGLVFFPMPKDISAPVPEKLLAATARAAAALRGQQVALVVGVSPWGALDEEAFINTHSGAVDVLLGSGGGSGFPARTSKDGKTLWTRAYIKGKTVNRLDLLSLPTGNGFTWKDGTYKAQVTALDAAYPQDPAIESLF
jgi:2',3'-cyclic-nucleotide 2'-phosphodiesterase (5'-nucleotidase family)